MSTREAGSPTRSLFDLGEDLVLGASYTFEVDVGWRNDRTAIPLYRIIFGARINGVWTELADIDNTDYQLMKGQFVHATLQYLATGIGGTLGEIGIQLRSEGFGQVNFDNVLVTSSPVPEPATMLLLGSGLIGLAGFGRKKLLKKA